jgi:hypothetical protein
MFGVILGFDIKNYSQNEKISDMKEQREKLSEIITTATRGIRIFERKEVVDTGDGCFLLIDTGDYENILLAMRQIQLKAQEVTDILFRGIIHLGKYEKTENIINNNTPNFVGDGINKAARYLNATCLKELLASNESKFVFGISREFYEKILDFENFDKNNYKRYGFQVKNLSDLIYLSTTDIKNLPEQEKIIKNIDLSLNDDFSSTLKKADFVYEANGCKSDLDTFYVFPELRIDKPEKDNSSKIFSDDLINKFITNPFNIVISGDDQSGKTSLCKQYFSMLYNSKDFIPIYLKMNFDERGHIDNKIADAFLKSYNKKIDGNFNNNIITLIIDDFHLLNKEQQKKYIKNISDKKNCFAIIFVDSLFLGSIEKQKLIESYKEYSIREFGHLKRNELIDKWVSYTGFDNNNFEKTDELAEYLNNTFIKGIIPYTPFYILTVLAASVDFAPINGELTSKGHCYEALIYISLRKMNIAENEIGAFLNILTHIAFDFYEKGINSFSDEMLDSFFSDYSKKFNIPFENKYFIKKMENSHIFSRNSIKQFSFYAPYLYHYFVAKYISGKVSDDNVKKHIEVIYNNLDDQTNAYIGIFIIHHCKNISVIEEVLLNTMLLYGEYPEINLNKDDVKHIDEYAIKLNKEIIDAYDKSEEERKKALLINDESEDEEEKIEESTEKEETSIMVQRFKKAIRTIEVLGHILKNHSNEIEIVHIKECFLNALNAYRRICNMFILGFKETENEFIDFVVDRISKIDSSLTRSEISELGQRYFVFYNLTAIYMTIKLAASALGSQSMMKTIIPEIVTEMDNPFGYCVYYQCEMWYNKGLPIEKAKSQYKNFPNTVKFVMRNLIKEYTDLHHIEMKTKQEIAEKFDMKVTQLTYNYEK